MEVIIRKQCLKDLRKVPKHIFTSADTVLDKLRSAENLNKSGVDFMQVKKKDKEYYRISLGDWRMGIELKTPSVIIITIKQRSEIYKKFPPQ
ncbi:MAG: type II toxin-antitoxin system RelE/ParE family toxin [Ginsengibacter sp.]